MAQINITRFPKKATEEEVLAIYGVGVVISTMYSILTNVTQLDKSAYKIQPVASTSDDIYRLPDAYALILSFPAGGIINIHLHTPDKGGESYVTSIGSHTGPKGMDAIVKWRQAWMFWKLGSVDLKEVVAIDRA
jgi:hypothetical protein